MCYLAPVQLDAQLEASLLRELMRRWRDYNHCFFQRAMKPPVFGLSDGREMLGRWEPKRRRILVSRPLVIEASWGAVLEVLKHEMAHQYVHEVLGVDDETAHGPAFRRVCERLGFDATASGLPSADADDEERMRLLQRVSDLLALAESSNRHEAENAAAAAQKMMLRHNIELCSRPGRKRYSFRYLGEPKGRRQESEHILAAILAEHFFVEAIWVSGYRPHDEKRGSVLELCGTPENLEIACYVHGFLQQTAERLWKEHKKRHGIRRNRDRRAYIAGVMEGFSERLSREKKAARERGLVWVGDADLSRYYRTRHPHVRAVRLQGHGESSARADGRAAGRDIVLRKGVRGSSSGGTPRLLPGKT
jgi:hypothetical protein